MLGIPDTQVAEAGGSSVQVQPGLQSKFEASLRNFVRPCLRTKSKNMGWDEA